MTRTGPTAHFPARSPDPYAHSPNPKAHSPARTQAYRTQAFRLQAFQA